MGEVLDGRLWRGELDEDPGVFWRGPGGRDVGPTDPAELTEVGAELGGVGLDRAAGELHAVRLKGGAAELAAHAARRADDRYAGQTSSGVGRRWFVSSITRRRVSRFSPASGIMGSRISSEQRPRMEAAVFTGIGFVSIKSARQSGSRS